MHPTNRISTRSCVLKAIFERFKGTSVGAVCLEQSLLHITLIIWSSRLCDDPECLIYISSWNIDLLSSGLVSALPVVPSELCAFLCEGMLRVVS